MYQLIAVAAIGTNTGVPAWLGFLGVVLVALFLLSRFLSRR
jgi:hypothetical protein